MNQNDIILLEAGTPDFERLKQAIAYAEETSSYVRLLIEPTVTEPVYEVGDRVRVHFDNGPGPATITGVGPEYIKVAYGPKDRYSTSLSRYSVSTDKRKTTPACLKVKAYEGEWSPAIESHRPKGGY